MRKFLVFVSAAFLLTAGFSAPLVNAQVVDDASPNSWPVTSKVVTTSPTANTVVSKNLYFGLRRSNEVMALQSFLSNRGYYNGPVTGNFLGQTLAAVKKFQKIHGLPTTGYFGPMSRKVINGLSDGPLSITPPSPLLRVGENMQLQAYYQPPMPPCPSGMFCAQVMPAPIEVEAEWSSTNPAIVRVEKTVVQCFTTPCPPQIRIYGEKAGDALIVATHTTEKGAKISAVALVQVKESDQGKLELFPASLELKVGETKELEALYTAPPPPCARATSGPICMIAYVRLPALVEWSVLNPGTGIVAKTFRSCANSVSHCPMATTTVTGLYPGVAELTATYLSELGMLQTSAKISVTQ
jgi:peptidoglycan hydrolase-like protein with peptidoglycan-binding domain